MNEIEKIKYLFDYKKGVVISEQAIPQTSGATSGSTTPYIAETAPV